METETPTPARGWYFFDGLMSRHGKTKVDNNTYLSREVSPEGDLLYVVTLHQTRILVFNRTRLTVRLDSGEWRTDLTRRRMSVYLASHGVKVVEAADEWLVIRNGHEDVPFVDGMEVAL